MKMISDEAISAILSANENAPNHTVLDSMRAAYASGVDSVNDMVIRQIAEMERANLRMQMSVLRMKRILADRNDMVAKARNEYLEVNSDGIHDCVTPYDCYPEVCLENSEQVQYGALDQLMEFQEGQWWVKELDGLSGKYNLTDDEKRAVAVVHNLLSVIGKLKV